MAVRCKSARRDVCRTQLAYVFRTPSSDVMCILLDEHAEKSEMGHGAKDHAEEK
jgi:hypothetical protein